MKTSYPKTSELFLALFAGVCLSATGLCAAKGSTVDSAGKPALRPSTQSEHHTTTPATAKKAETPARTSQSVPSRTVTAHSGTTHSVARGSAQHASSATSAKGRPNRTTAYASQRSGSSARSRSRRHNLTGQQRLARLHLQPDRVQEIQQALIREGYLHGDADGQWDSRTHDAMQRYQTDHGFLATGLPEAKSLMKLGLGSHPLPSELDHGPSATSDAAPADLPAAPASPPVSQVTPPS